MARTIKQKTGDRYEQLACQILSKQGLLIKFVNYAVAGVGEIDIIAEHCQIKRGVPSFELVFIEVRSRKQNSYADALMSVTLAKQRKIVRTAEQFLQDYPQYQSWACRFDVMGFTISESAVSHEWIVGAFGE